MDFLQYLSIAVEALIAVLGLLIALPKKKAYGWGLFLTFTIYVFYDLSRLISLDREGGFQESLEPLLDRAGDMTTLKNLAGDQRVTHHPFLVVGNHLQDVFILFGGSQKSDCLVGSPAINDQGFEQFPVARQAVAEKIQDRRGNVRTQNGPENIGRDAGQALGGFSPNLGIGILLEVILQNHQFPGREWHRSPGD